MLMTIFKVGNSEKRNTEWAVMMLFSLWFSQMISLLQSGILFVE